MMRRARDTKLVKNDGSAVPSTVMPFRSESIRIRTCVKKSGMKYSELDIHTRSISGKVAVCKVSAMMAITEYPAWRNIGSLDDRDRTTEPSKSVSWR